MTRRKKANEKKKRKAMYICVSDTSATCYARSQRNALNQLILLLCVDDVVVVSNVWLNVWNDWYNDLRFDWISFMLPLSHNVTHLRCKYREINMMGHLQYGTKLNGNFNFFSGFHAHQWKWTQTLAHTHSHVMHTHIHTTAVSVYILRRSFIFLLQLL